VVLLVLVAQVYASSIPFSNGKFIATNFDGPNQLYPADIDGDGDLDVASGSRFGNEVGWWENTSGDGSTWDEHILDTNFGGAMDVHVADVDGDNDLDILAAAEFDHTIAWWENDAGDGSSWTKRNIDISFVSAHDVYAADVDGDGDMDVLGAARDRDELAWWENTNGSGTSWTKHVVTSSFDGTRGVYAADIDGDGDVDVVGAADFVNEVSWWENTNGSGTSWTKHVVTDTFPKPIKVRAADIDGDGDMDVASAGNAVMWWENTNGAGTSWTEHVVESKVSGAWSIELVDLDQDNDMDIICSVFWGPDIFWWENTSGDGSSWTRYAVDENLTGPMDGHGADVDGDGDLDVLGADELDGLLIWWENQSTNTSPADTPTASATATATTEPSATATATSVPSATATATNGPSATATATTEPSATATATSVPSATATATNTPSATATATNGPSATATATLEAGSGGLVQAINLGGAAVEIDGNIWTASADTANFSSNGWDGNNPWMTLSPATDAGRTTMLRTWHQYWAFDIAISNLPADTYEVYVYTVESWDNPNPDSVGLNLEGQQVDAYTSDSGKGAWTRRGPYAVVLSDGTLNLTSSGLENIAGIEIWTAGAGGSIPTVTPEPSSTSTATPEPSATATAVPSATATATATATSEPGSVITTFVQGVNLNGAAVQIDGNTWTASADTANFSSNGWNGNNPWMTLNPATDAGRTTMLHTWQQYWAFDIAISNLPANTYEVYVYTVESWDNPNPDGVSLNLEGQQVDAYTSDSGKGAWTRRGPYTVVLSDGTLNLTSGGLENIAGIEIWAVE
jgi:membrane protein implicated in regulation of membrane protease activity